MEVDLGRENPSSSSIFSPDFFANSFIVPFFYLALAFNQNCRALLMECFYSTVCVVFDTKEINIFFIYQVQNNIVL